VPLPQHLFAALVAIALALAAMIGPVGAHSELRLSEPGDGAVLQAPPQQLKLAFNETVQLTALRLLAEGGERIALPTREIAGRKQEEIALPVLFPGAYRVDWAAISADGHPISGTIRFSINP